MSTTLGDVAGYIRHCDTCSTAFDTSNSPHEEHCSRECYFQDKGDGALNQLASDHKLCSSCFRYVKSTHRPSTDFLEDRASKVRNALEAGGEYSEVDGKVVLDVRDARTKRQPGIETNQGFCYIGMQYPTTHTRYLHGSSGKWVCECGNVDLQHHNDLLARVDYDETLACLLSRLDEFFEKGAIQESPTESVFYEWLEKDDYGLETAVGASLHA